MSRRPLDFRSDTVTRPTPAMLKAMTEAETGDDVYGEDPTVNRLQKKIAELLGKEAAIFAPSGTMTNQIGVRIHCQPGDEFICEAGCHIFNYEQAAFAQLSGLVARTVEGDCGVLRLEQLTELLRPNDPHNARSRLVCIENTHNRGSGRVQPQDDVVRICDWAHDHGLATHLDGARLFNASVATGISPKELAEPFDTVSVCFSKGLGAPIGSALAGPAPLIAKALRVRKLFGGAMRQVGVIASAALYALDNNVERLAEDHANAQVLAAGIRKIEGLTLRTEKIDTNLVIFRVDPKLGTSPAFAARLREHGLLVGAFGGQLLRAVTHLDVNRADCDAAIGILREVTAQAAEKPATSAAPRGAYA
jgi:threonine aldolase